MKVFAIHVTGGAGAKANTKTPKTTNADAYRQKLFGNAGRDGALRNKTIGQLLGNRSASGNPLRK